jgi:hypothetical protein
MTHSGMCRVTDQPRKINVRLFWNRRKVKSRQISRLGQRTEAGSIYDSAQCELDSRCELDLSCEQVALCEVFRLACGDKDLGSCHIGTRME